MSTPDRYPNGKSGYSQPKLKVYGGMAKLTATGTIMGNENSGSMMNEFP